MEVVISVILVGICVYYVCLLLINRRMREEARYRDDERHHLNQRINYLNDRVDQLEHRCPGRTILK